MDVESCSEKFPIMRERVVHCAKIVLNVLDFEWQLHNVILGLSETTSVVPCSTEGVVENLYLVL